MAWDEAFKTLEVDLVITRGRQTWGVEVKSAVTATPADGQGLRRLAEQCGAALGHVGAAMPIGSCATACRCG